MIRFAGTAALCALLLAGTSSPAAATSTPEADEPGCSPTREPTNHVVLFEEGTDRETATAAIDTACGTTLVYYPPIATAIATSTDAGFARRMGPQRTHTAPVDEAHTPELAHPDGLPIDPDDIQHTTSNAAADQESSWISRTINTDTAHAVTRGDRDVVVAVLDSGIDGRHPALADSFDADLSAGCLSGKPVTSRHAWSARGNRARSVHGTHVAGIIAAAPNAAPVTGVAPDVRVASIRVIDSRGAATPRAAICGLMWAAAHDVTVANASFVLTPRSGCTSSVGDAESRTADSVTREALRRAVEYAAETGTVTVAAATNQAHKLRFGTRTSPTTGRCRPLPASLPEAVTVSALSSQGSKAGYSSYGLGVIDVAAPGGDVDSCVPSSVPDGYARMCGTSMAAAYTSGVLALLASTHPEYSATELSRTLSEQAVPQPCPNDYDLDGDGRQDAYCTGYAGYNGFYGHGVVDAATAVDPPITASAQ